MASTGPILEVAYAITLWRFLASSFIKVVTKAAATKLTNSNNPHLTCSINYSPFYQVIS